MCDFFWQRMDNTDQGGDLADIVRSVSAAAGEGGPWSSSSDLTAATNTDCASWQFPTDPAAASFQQRSADEFGLRDPLLHELTGTSAFFDGGCRPEKSGGGVGGGCSASTTTVSDHQLLAAAHHREILIGDEMMKRPCSNLFSRVLQISPAKPSPLSPRLPMVPAHGHGDIVKLEHGVQLSSPRAPGIKRRKSQAKKVVCIPAPAAASSRPSGEVIPSDLWAWRKYGQKPIKGSPYPRGYYRCSSSKGCSARKQVERSRTDPNMLVITYTSEHNHPWPTQRNALAGSTRSQPSKNTATASPASATKNSPRQPTTTPKKEPKETTTTTTTTSSSSLPTLVKEEVVLAEMENDATMEVQMGNDHDAFNQVFYNEPINQSDDFYADLAELEPDPLSLIFSRSGFMGDQNKSDEEEKESCNKGVDPFIDMFEWGGRSSSSFGDQFTKEGL